MTAHTTDSGLDKWEWQLTGNQHHTSICAL